MMCACMQFMQIELQEVDLDCASSSGDGTNNEGERR